MRIYREEELRVRRSGSQKRALLVIPVRSRCLTARPNYDQFTLETEWENPPPRSPANVLGVMPHTRRHDIKLNHKGAIQSSDW